MQKLTRTPEIAVVYEKTQLLWSSLQCFNPLAFCFNNISDNEAALARNLLSELYPVSGPREITVLKSYQFSLIMPAQAGPLA